MVNIAPINQGEKHVAAALIVDTSISMMGRPIEELNKGLKEFGEGLRQDSLALGRADVTVISFNSTVKIEIPFCPADQYQAPELAVDGLTALNEAIDTALDALEERKKLYRDTGVEYYRPWLFVLTDGKASDEEREASTKARLREYIERNKVVFMPMGIGKNADIAKLQDYYPENAPKKPVLTADSKSFKEAFVWLSNSIVEVAKADISGLEQISLPDTPDNILTVGVN